MENLLIVSGQVAVLFALMAVGFACQKTKALTEVGIGDAVTLLVCVVNPCLIAHAFNRRFDPAMMKGLLIALAIGFVTHLVLIFLARLFFRGGAESTRVVLKMSSVFSNAGFMGVPLEQAILGPEGVFYGVAYVVVFNLFIWSWGLAQCADGKITLNRKMFLNPGMYAITAGLAVFLLPFDLPSIASRTLESIAAMNTPLAMIMIGYYLGGARFAAVFRLPAAYGAVAFRLVLAPLLVIGALFFFRHTLDRTLILALVIPASAPVAAMTSMFAARYERDVDLSAALVSVTTLLSIVTMPVLIAVAMALTLIHVR